MKPHAGPRPGRRHAFARRAGATMFCLVATAALAVEGLVPGAAVTYRDPFGQAWCATIQTVEIGIAGVPIAWVTIDADPRRVFHAALSELTPGCSR